MSEAVGTDRDPSGQNGKRKSKLVFLVLFLLLGGTIVSAYWWVFMRDRVFTDNAYVMADTAIVSSRVSGTIAAIGVENDDWVSAGDVLLKLDPVDYQAEVDKHRGALARIEAEIEMGEVSIRLTDSQTQAQLQAAEAAVSSAQEKEKELRYRLSELEGNRAAVHADLGHAERDYERYANLLKEGAGSEQQRDKTSTAFKKAKAEMEASSAKISAARASLAAAVQEIERARAQRDGARADLLRVEIEKKNVSALKGKRSETQASLRSAELNLSYCTIKAPVSGYIAKKRSQVGERVQPAQPILAIVPLAEVYVEANFKETQLKNVRMGQPVEIKADLYPGYTYHGKVAGIRAGTGAAFSLLPPENATGNWIKVVQRIPVKIALDVPPPAQCPLRVGGSLEVTILTGDKSGGMLRATTAGVASGGGRAE